MSAIDISKKLPSPKNAVVRAYDLSAAVGWLLLVWADVSDVVLYVCLQINGLYQRRWKAFNPKKRV